MRLYKTKILGFAGVMAAAVMFASGAFASAASASPVWVVNGKVLATKAEKQAIISKGYALEEHWFRLQTHNAAGEITNVIRCESEHNSGELIGGEPGTDTAEVNFDKCKVIYSPGTFKAAEGCIATTAGKAKGEIGPVDVLTALGYPTGRAPNTEKAFDQFFPASATNVFAEFELQECPNLGGAANGTKIVVHATGTEVGIVKEETFNRRCGVISEVGKPTTTTPWFAETVSGEEANPGALRFPGRATPVTTGEPNYLGNNEPVTTEELEEEIAPGVSEFVPVECTLEAVVNNAGEAAEEVGLSEVETVPAMSFGWKV